MKRIVLALSLVLFCTPRLHAQGQFFEGKTAKIIAGFGAGSVDDAWSRMLARFMGKHIAGTPNFLVQNMPGAGAMIAANYVYSVANLMDSPWPAFAPGFTSTSWCGASKCNSTGANSPGSAVRRSPIR